MRDPGGFEAREVYFQDRHAAGRTLGAALVTRGVLADVVMGLTRGGVPVAFEVSAALGAQLDLIVVKKLGSPFSHELAIGAVCSDGTLVTRPDAVHEMGVPEDYLERETAERSREAKEAEDRYRGGFPALDLSGARVVVVDDGIATGATMEAAARSARKRGASRVIIAVPVSSEHAAQALPAVVDEFIALGTPAMFWAVGQFYEDFSPVEDELVRDLLARGRARRQARSPGAYPI